MINCSIMFSLVGGNELQKYQKKLTYERFFCPLGPKIQFFKHNLLQPNVLKNNFFHQFGDNKLNNKYSNMVEHGLFRCLFYKIDNE